MVSFTTIDKRKHICMRKNKIIKTASCYPALALAVFCLRYEMFMPCLLY